MLIDPELLKKQIQDCISQCYRLRIDSVGPLTMFLDYIKDAPRIEAKEVIHGRWNEKQEPISWCEDDVEVFFECSICGIYSPGETNYCPNCGAKMDGGNEDGR